MVKADVRRDYYADLGVGPGADTDEIKKQFRKLGTYSSFLAYGL
jgi:curved DNA-binding protein CbpA